MRDASRIAISLTALALGACASSPGVRVTASGTFPRGGTYRVVPAEQATPLAALVSARLDGLGLSQSDEPRYLVQIGTFARPAQVGIFVPDADARHWLRSPAPGGKQAVRGLTITFTEPRSGREIYRVTAAEGGREDTPADVFADLVAASLTGPPAPGSS